MICKRITVPDDVTPEFAGKQGAPISFCALVADTLLSDPSWGKNVDLLEARSQIRHAVAGKRPGELVELRVGDWETLSSVTRTPTNPYNPILGEAILPMLRAIIDAPTITIE